MPKIYLSNPGTYETVTRPVILEVAREILAATGLPEDMQILYAGDAQRAIQPGSAMSGRKAHDGLATFASGDKITIDVEETHDPDRTFSAAVYESENRPIFLDERVQTLIKPVYSPQDVVISFRYRSKDKTGAMRWRDEIRARVAQMQDQRLHRASYSYLVPEEFLVILKEIHRMMEAQGGYGQAYDQWFRLYGTQKLTTVTTQAGTQPHTAMSETQMRIVGYFDFDSAPEAGEKNNEGTDWTINFTYKFKYDKPIGCVMMYPLMVHNQLIKYRPSKPQELVEAHQRTYTKSAAALAAFEKGSKLLGVQSGVAIPTYDEFVPSSVPQDTLRIFTALTSRSNLPSPATNLALMDLIDLGGDVKLHERLLRFLRESEWSFLTQHLLSVFHITLYANQHMRPASKIEVDEDLNISSTELLSLRDYYHIRMSFVEDFSLLNIAAQERLRHNADVVCLILKWLGLEHLYPITVGADTLLGFKPENDFERYKALINEELTFDRNVLPSVFASNYIARFDWIRLIEGMSTAPILTGPQFVRQFNTVMTLTVETHKESDLADR